MESTAFRQARTTKLLADMKSACRFTGAKQKQLIMSAKITAILLLAVLLQVSARTVAQVTIREKSASLEKVLTQIKEQSGYGFIYDGALLRAKARPVSVNITNVPIERALEEVFRGQDQLSYSMNGKVISIKEKAGKKLELVTEVLSPRLESPPPTVHGRITNEKGEAVAGVSISIKGGKTIGVTNDNGEFTLTNVPDNAILVFSAVNTETREVALNGRVEVNLGLKSKVSVLDEVQMIAYGQTSKRLQTGNVTTVKGEDIAKQPVSNPLLALEGRVPGLFITQANGLPGSGVTVRIQGQNSINGGNSPFYLVDGVPYASQMLQTTSGGPLGSSGGALIYGQSGGGNPFSYINPNDIESIEVLKDADATAIYGSRAANGAIIITTKKGKIGSPILNVNMQTGWGKVTRKMDLLNTSQYLSMRHEAFANDGVSNIPATNYDLTLWDTTRNTDWQKELIGGTAKYTNIYTNYSGGNINTQYNFGANYHKETTVFPGDYNDQKGSFNFSISNISPDQKFSIQFNTNYLVDQNYLPRNDITLSALQLAPDAPALYNPDGSLNWAPTASGTSSWTNPLAGLVNRIYKNKTSNLISNLVLNYKILNGLEIKTSLGYTNLQTNEFSSSPLSVSKPESRATATRSASYMHSNINSWIIEPQINYKRALGRGKFEGLIGMTIQENLNSGEQLSGSGYTSDQVMEDIKSAATISVGSSIESEYKYNAFFGRMNYNWQDKYLINLTARRDGSSRFGPENRFHNFSAIGVGWIFSNDSLIQKHIKFLSFGKLKASYGSTGSDQIGDYSYLSLYGPNSTGIPYQNTTGLSPQGLFNGRLEWEETRKMQIGLDLGFISNKILFSIDYSSNRSSNQLLAYNLPMTTGFGGITQNFPATLQNTSWEFSLTSVNFKSNSFSWSSNLNLTIPDSKIVSFPNLANSSYASTLIIGQPLFINPVYHFLGVDPVSGGYQFSDSRGGVTFRPDTASNLTRSVLENSLPIYYGGLQNSLSFKNIDIDFLIQFVNQIAQQYLYNGLPGEFAGGFRNQPVSVLDHWRKSGDIGYIQKISQNGTLNNSLLNNTNSNASSSDFVYGDASYIRLKSVSISYRLSRKWMSRAHIKNCSLYMQGQNLLTFTKYKGLDPENKSTTSLPPLRVLTIGFKIGL